MAAGLVEVSAALEDTELLGRTDDEDALFPDDEDALSADDGDALSERLEPDEGDTVLEIAEPDEGEPVVETAEPDEEDPVLERTEADDADTLLNLALEVEDRDLLLVLALGDSLLVLALVVDDRDLLLDLALEVDDGDVVSETAEPDEGDPVLEKRVDAADADVREPVSVVLEASFLTALGIMPALATAVKHKRICSKCILSDEDKVKPKATLKNLGEVEMRYVRMTVDELGNMEFSRKEERRKEKNGRKRNTKGAGESGVSLVKYLTSLLKMTESSNFKKP